MMQRWNRLLTAQNVINCPASYHKRHVKLLADGMGAQDEKGARIGDMERRADAPPTLGTRKKTVVTEPPRQTERTFGRQDWNQRPVESFPRPIQMNKQKPIQMNTSRPFRVETSNLFQLNVPRSTQMNKQKPIQMSMPRPSQMNTPRPSQMSMPRPSQMNTPRPSQMNTPGWDDPETRRLSRKWKTIVMMPENDSSGTERRGSQAPGFQDRQGNSKPKRQTRETQNASESNRANGKEPKKGAISSEQRRNAVAPRERPLPTREPTKGNGFQSRDAAEEPKEGKKRRGRKKNCFCVCLAIRDSKELGMRGIERIHFGNNRGRIMAEGNNEKE